MFMMLTALYHLNVHDEIADFLGLDTDTLVSTTFMYTVSQVYVLGIRVKCHKGLLDTLVIVIHVPYIMYMF